MRKKECIAMLLAGGQGNRLKELTGNIAKPAVSFAGKYRIIDFSLSNCANSLIDTVGVLIQYRPMSLNRYLGMGAAWDLDASDGGVHVLPPYVTQRGGSWYVGTADSIYQNIDFMDSFSPSYVIILSGDHLYSMDYRKMLEYHKEKKADLTVSVKRVPMSEASRFGIMSVDSGNRIVRFAEKPEKPESDLASMGIYVFSYPVLREALLKDHDDQQSSHDFGKNVIPTLLSEGRSLYAYDFSGYWKDIGTVQSYYDAHFDILDSDDFLKVCGSDAKVYSNSFGLYPAHRTGRLASVADSMICDGAVVDGTVRHSFIGCGAVVEEGAEVIDSLVLPDARVGANSRVHHAIVNERSSVPAGTVFGNRDEVLIYSKEAER